MSDLDLRPTEERILIPRDTDVTLVVTLSHGSVAPDIDLDTITLTVAASLGATPLFTLTNLPGMHSDPTHGITTFTIARARTAAAETFYSTSWHYEIRRIVGVTLEQYVYAAGILAVVPTK